MTKVVCTYHSDAILFNITWRRGEEDKELKIKVKIFNFKIKIQKKRKKEFWNSAYYPAHQLPRLLEMADQREEEEGENDVLRKQG